MNWTQSPTSKNVLRKGDWTIVRFKWSYCTNYILWNGSKYIGRYSSADEAKGEVK